MILDTMLNSCDDIGERLKMGNVRSPEWCMHHLTSHFLGPNWYSMSFDTVFIFMDAARAILYKYPRHRFGWRSWSTFSSTQRYKMISFNQQKKTWIHVNQC